MKYGVLIERDREGNYVAWVPELPGCHARSKNPDWAMIRLRSAIRLHMEISDPDAGPGYELVDIKVIDEGKPLKVAAVA